MRMSSADDHKMDVSKKYFRSGLRWSLEWIVRGLSKKFVEFLYNFFI